MREDLMIDFETLGTTEDSVLLSGAVCLFNRETGVILEEYYQEFNVRQQILEGLKVSPETVAWWRKENPKEFERLLWCSEDEYPEEWLRRVLQGFHKKYKNIWSRGCMDAHILKYHVKDIPYWVFKDLRTMDIFGLKMDPNRHHALEDCRNQIKYLTEVIQQCNARDVGEQQMKQMVPVRTAENIGSLTS